MCSADWNLTVYSTKKKHKMEIAVIPLGLHDICGLLLPSRQTVGSFWWIFILFVYTMNSQLSDALGKHHYEILYKWISVKFCKMQSLASLLHKISMEGRSFCHGFNPTSNVPPPFMPSSGLSRTIFSMIWLMTCSNKSTTLQYDISNAD